MKQTARSIFKILTLMLFTSTAVAQEHIKLKNEVFKEIMTVNEDGSKQYKLVEAAKAIPGDEMVYITTFTNIGNEDVTDIVITNPIPNNSLYKSGSAFGSGTEITYSIDDGKTYAAAEALTVKDQDGQSRSATAEDYTTIK